MMSFQIGQLNRVTAKAKGRVRQASQHVRALDLLTASHAFASLLIPSHAFASLLTALASLLTDCQDQEADLAHDDDDGGGQCQRELR